MARLFWLSVVVLCVSLLGLAMPLATAVGAEKSAVDLRRAMEKGNYKDAYDGLSALILTAEGTDNLNNDYSLCIQALNNLGRVDEFDAFAEKAIAAHAADWKFLHHAANQYRDQVNHYGSIVAGVFYRGDRRGNDGKWVSSFDRDRIRALQLYQQAMDLVQKDARADKSAQARFYYQLSTTLMSGQNGTDAWRLQFASDLSQLPDYEESSRYGYYGRGYDGYPNVRGAPVDDQGNPVFHTLPKSWEAATTDGQRWRWALLQASELDTNLSNQIRWEFATFLRNQFDVQTMASSGNLFRNSGEDNKKDESGPYAAWTLGEDETIAKLANGIKRFKLPDEFNFIKILQAIVANDRGNRSYQANAADLLAQIFTDRQQYPKAAEYWKSAITKFTAGHDRYREKALQQIIGNWTMFEPQMTQPTGDAGATVQLRFRNATKVSFDAKELNVPLLLSDVKDHIRNASKENNPKLKNRGQLDWEKIDISNIGYRLVEKNQAKYIGAQVAAWDLDLKPRPQHFDRFITVQTPLKKAGAFLLTAKLADGNISRVIVWLADTAIVRKPLSDSSMTFVADAVTGQPIEGATLDFFGYQQRWVKDNNYQIEISEKTATTSTDGISLANFMKDANQPADADPNAAVQQKLSIPANMNWITTATTKEGRFAFHGFSSIWYSRYYDQYDSQYNQTKAFIMTDRPVYRPGQVVKWKVWLGHNKYDQDGKSPFAGSNTTLRITTPKGDTLKDVAGALDDFGGLSGEFTLEKEATLGSYTFSQLNGYGATSFRVEEYKKPEFEVKIDAPTDPVMLGDKVTATVQAKYYFGAPVTSAKAKVKVTRTAHDARWYPYARWDWFYEPGYWWFACDYKWYPGFYEWGCFAPHRIWWGGWSPEQPEVVSETEVPISPDGTLKIDIDTAVAKAAYADQDHKYEITAEVTDASRRTIVGTGEVLVARKPFKVYAWLDRGHYNVGDTIRANFTAQTLDNKPVKGAGSVRLLAITYDKSNKPVETEVQNWKLDPKDDGTAALQYKAAAPGQYRLSYQVTDAKNRMIEGGYVFVVRGEGFDGKDFRFNDVEVITDKKEYAAGEKIKLLINVNRADAAVLLFIRPSNGIYLPPKVIRMKGKSAVEEIEVGKKDMPNFFVEALTVANAKIHTDVREVIVPPEDRILNVTITSDAAEYRPGTKAKLTVNVTEKNGEPFTGSAVVSLYDKAVEYISGGSNITDIRKYFWQWRRTHYVRNESSLDKNSYNLLRSTEIPMSFLGVFGYQSAEFAHGKTGIDQRYDGQSEVTAGALRGANKVTGSRGREMSDAEAAAAPASAMPVTSPLNAMKNSEAARAPGDPPSGPGVEPSIRSNFADTALWAPSLITAKNGTATVEVTMPENLTTWKAKVWTLGNGTRVGQGEAEVITTKKLIVRLQAPRFFVQKDEVVLSANVHNYLATAKEVKVQLELEGDTLEPMTDITKSPKLGREQIVTVNPQGEARIDWRVKVLKEGTAVIRIKAITNEESDGTQMSFPVFVHGMLKMDSYSGVVRGNAPSSSLNFTVPKERRMDDSRLEVRYSPSLASAMVDALPYLVDYPYGCTEQTLNRFVPTVITQKILLDMKLDLDAIQKKRTNLNAQEIGDDKERAAQWKQKRWDRNPVFDNAEVAKMVTEGIARLSNMQLTDGGWGWFSGYGEQSYPHTTAVVVNGLMIARDNGAKIDENVLNRGIQWLSAWQNTRLQWIKAKPKERTADDMDALAYYILVNAENDNKEMREFLYRDRLNMAVYTKSILGLAFHKVKDQDKLDTILDNIRQYVVTDDENQTTYLKMPESNYWWCWYGSDMEAHAYYLKLLAKTDPKGQTASRLVKYMLNNRKHATYWNSTRDTAYCIEALADYIRASGEDNPDLTVKIHFNGKQIKEVKIDKDNLFTFDNKLVLTGAEVPDGTHKLEVLREGAGSVYFNAYLTNFTLEDHITRAGLEVKINRKIYSLARADKTVKAEGGHGQVVDKRVEKYTRTELTDLATIKSGDLVEVELEIDSKNDYEYIILEDMKAAGFEPVEVRSGYNGNDMNAYVEFRDEKVAFFVRQLARGKHSVSYRLRAEIPGKFSALPAKAYAMYAPELKGNSEEIKLNILDTESVIKPAAKNTPRDGVAPVLPRPQGFQGKGR